MIRVPPVWLPSCLYLKSLLSLLLVNVPGSYDSLGRMSSSQEWQSVFSVSFQAGVKHVILAVSYRAELLEKRMNEEAQRVSSHFFLPTRPSTSMWRGLIVLALYSLCLTDLCSADRYFTFLDWVMLIMDTVVKWLVFGLECTIFW